MSSSQPALGPELAMLEVEKAMQTWFPASVPVAERQPFSEVDLRNLSNALRSTGRETWSRIPRVYATLRSINQLPLIDVFLIQGLNDVWFPFSHKTLPESIRSQTARSDFIAAQRLVLNKSLDLEKEDGKHRHYLNQEDVPLIRLAELGRGGFAVVEKVVSTISYKEYARKLLLRGPTFRKNKAVLVEFESELAVLKRLSHFHIVELIGSYTDPKHVGILTSPVAECNLKDYLAGTLSEDTLLRTSFGCLAAAVNYLHQSKIRHKDIKPSNILIKDRRMLITDFGISRDWSDEERSTTTGLTFMTPKYCAPEVANYQGRNSLSDMWSLGCVFLEIWTVLHGESTSTLESHLISTGSKSRCYHSNIDAVWSWSRMLSSKSQDPSLKVPHTWIATMMEIDQDKRCNARMLLELIQEHGLMSDTRLSFIGQCCTDEDDTGESVVNSVYELEMDEIAPETTKSSAMSRESSEAAILGPVILPTTGNLPGQADLQLNSLSTVQLGVRHLSMQEQGEEGCEPISTDQVEGSSDSEDVKASPRRAQATRVSKTPPNPSFVPPQLTTKEATRPPLAMVEKAVSQPSNTSIRPAKPTVSNHNAASALPQIHDASLLSVPDLRSREPVPVRENPSIVNSGTSILLKVSIDGTQKRLKVEFLSLLHSNIFFDTLRVLLSIPIEQRIFVERFSYSGASWIVLDPEDQVRWKAMLRAAKAMLRLRLRVTTMTAVEVVRDQITLSSKEIENAGIDQRESSDSQPVLVNLRFRGKGKKVNIPLQRFLDAPTLIAALRHELDVPANLNIIFERYSDSAAEYIIIDPVNVQSHRQTRRAARLKGKIRVRAVVSDA